MDARRKDQRFKKIWPMRSPSWCSLRWLSLVLWQGYGEWLVAAVKSHVG